MVYSGKQLLKMAGESDASNPSLFTGMSVTIATAIVSLLVQFFPNISLGMQNSILGILLIFIPMITAILIRRKVWSPESVQRVISAQALQTRDEIRDEIFKKGEPLLKRGQNSGIILGKDSPGKATFNVEKEDSYDPPPKLEMLSEDVFPEDVDRNKHFE